MRFSNVFVAAIAVFLLMGTVLNLALMDVSLHAHFAFPPVGHDSDGVKASGTIALFLLVCTMLNLALSIVVLVGASLNLLAVDSNSDTSLDGIESDQSNSNDPLIACMHAHTQRVMDEIEKCHQASTYKIDTFRSICQTLMVHMDVSRAKELNNWKSEIHALEGRLEGLMSIAKDEIIIRILREGLAMDETNARGRLD